MTEAFLTKKGAGKMLLGFTLLCNHLQDMQRVYS